MLYFAQLLYKCAKQILENYSTISNQTDGSFLFGWGRNIELSKLKRQEADNLRKTFKTKHFTGQTPDAIKIQIIENIHTSLDTARRISNEAGCNEGYYAPYIDLLQKTVENSYFYLEKYGLLQLTTEEIQASPQLLLKTALVEYIIEKSLHKKVKSLKLTDYLKLKFEDEGITQDKRELAGATIEDLDVFLEKYTLEQLDLFKYIDDTIDATIAREAQIHLRHGISFNLPVQAAAIILPNISIPIQIQSQPATLNYRLLSVKNNIKELRRACLRKTAAEQRPAEYTASSQDTGPQIIVKKRSRSNSIPIEPATAAVPEQTGLSQSLDVREKATTLGNA